MNSYEWCSWRFSYRGDYADATCGSPFPKCVRTYSLCKSIISLQRPLDGFTARFRSSCCNICILLPFDNLALSLQMTFMTIPEWSTPFWQQDYNTINGRLLGRNEKLNIVQSSTTLRSSLFGRCPELMHVLNVCILSRSKLRCVVKLLILSRYTKILWS